MKTTKKGKILAVIYLIFWMGVFGIVISDRFTPEGDQSILSEFAVVASSGEEKDSGGKEDQVGQAFFAEPYISTGTERQRIRGIYSEASYADRRVQAIEIMLANNRSPMIDCAHVFVEEADRYGFDWRLTVSIALVETRAGAVSPGYKTGNYLYNPFGFKTREGYMRFDSWEHSIVYVSERLANGYGLNRLDPDVMQATYCPPCEASGEDRWANGVKSFMNQAEYLYEELGANSGGTDEQNEVNEQTQ